ncbi:hypothetical protein ES332_D04G148400v1 [Gossypium tomentosum]|uniref:Uncharacterized protein n=1 Tax=Gossypium tomentosum TaxID=34277 RepID=A0A5D2LDL2_GOSTO|nr:hypothetical protein ES332_D04G148400v1 [Gossypium tomentosum]
MNPLLGFTFFSAAAVNKGVSRRPSLPRSPITTQRGKSQPRQFLSISMLLFSFAPWLLRVYLCFASAFVRRKDVACTEASWRRVEALHAWGVARHAQKMALVAAALEAVMLKTRVSDSFCVGLGSNLVQGSGLGTLDICLMGFRYVILGLVNFCNSRLLIGLNWVIIFYIFIRRAQGKIWALQLVFW